MLEILIDFFTDKENTGEIIVIILTAIGVFYRPIWKLLKWLGRLLKKMKVPASFKRFKKWLAYKRTIGKLERLEIREIPRGFLVGKSPEKNPELKKVYHLMKEGLLKPPPLYVLDEMLKDTHGIEFKINWDALKDKATPKIPNHKPPEPPNFRK